MFTACSVKQIGPCEDKGEFPFKLAGPLGGFTDTMASSHVWRADHEIKNNAPWMTGSRGSGKVINVSAFPLYQAGRPGRWVPGSTALQLVPGRSIGAVHRDQLA